MVAACEGRRLIVRSHNRLRSALTTGCPAGSADVWAFSIGRAPLRSSVRTPNSFKRSPGSLLFSCPEIAGTRRGRGHRKCATTGTFSDLSQCGLTRVACSRRLITHVGQTSCEEERVRNTRPPAGSRSYLTLAFGRRLARRSPAAQRHIRVNVPGSGVVTAFTVTAVGPA